MALGAIILVLASFIHQRPLRIYIYIIWSQLLG